MPSSDPSGYKFEWGQAVEIRAGAPDKFQHIAKGSVRGIRIVDSPAIAAVMQEPLGTVLYLVENDQGMALEIPERFLLAR